MWHTLPFLVIPKEIIIEMVSRVCRFLNMFPAKEGLSNHYSPLQILTGEVADYRFDGQYPFCAYCLASHEANPRNTMEPRALNALYMDRIPNSKTGGHKVYDLETHEIVTRHYVRVLPMTKTVVTCIEERAYKQGQKPLKFHKRDKVKFSPHGVLTGVAGEELGYETLLAAIEAEESDEELWENEDEDLPHDLPGLADGFESSDDESSVSSEATDAEDDNDNFWNNVSTPPLRPTTIEVNFEDVPPQFEVVPPEKAPKLPTVGIRRSARIAAMKALMQEYNQHPITKAQKEKEEIHYHLYTEAEMEHNIPTQMFSTENKNYVEEYERGLAQVMCNYVMEMNHRAAALPQGVNSTCSRKV